MAGHGIKELRKVAHTYKPFPGNVICRCGLRSNHKIHQVPAK